VAEPVVGQEKIGLRLLANLSGTGGRKKKEQVFFPALQVKSCGVQKQFSLIKKIFGV